MKRLVFALSILLCISVFAGCNGYTQTSKAPVLAERLEGIYRGEGNDGEIILQIYWIDDRLIAEIEEEYAAYYAMELFWTDADLIYSDSATEAEFYSFSFSGFSGFGEYFEENEKLGVALTDSGLDQTKDGNITAFVRDEFAQPIHIYDRYSEFFYEEKPEKHYPDKLIGKWHSVSADGHGIYLCLEENGSFTWCEKQENQPIRMYTGLGLLEEETQSLRLVCERVGYASMPFQYTLKCSIDRERIHLEGTENEDPILPGAEAVFTRLTDKE